MKIKALLSAMMILCLGITSTQVVNAEDIAEETPESVRDYINENATWGKVKTNGSIPVGNKEISLLVTFESQEDALLKFKQMYNENISLMKVQENLQELSDENYNEYFSLLRKDGEKYFPLDELNTIYAFFDIYENNDHNQIIKENAMKLNFRSTLAEKNQLLEEIDSLSPDYNERVSQVAESRYVTHLSQINVSAATAYARKYGPENKYNRNYNYYSADCTNFASQIAYAGGLRQGTSWKPYTKPWINANSFAIAWGKKGNSKKWSDFVKTLKPGKFIGADYSGDGTLDHIAYITANGSTSTIKEIAQHTGDYVKMSDKTGWKNDSPTRILWIIGNP